MRLSKQVQQTLQPSLMRSDPGDPIIASCGFICPISVTVIRFETDADA